VSQGTVDRIIHNRGQVSQENINKVNAIINKHGYKKNIFASNLALNKKYTFAIFLPKNKDLEYWESVMSGIERGREEFKQFNISCQYYLYDYNSISFKKMKAKLLKQKHDGLLFAPIFYDDSILFLDEYKKLNTPIVMIDSNIKHTAISASIGQDAFKSGYLAGKLISLGSTENKQILIIKITQEIEGTSIYQQRIKGFYSFFEKNKKISKIKISEIILKRNQQELDVKIFQKIDSIFVPNSRSYIIAEFLKNNNLNNINIVGYDILKENVIYLKEGIINFLINQKPEIQGYLGVEYLYKKIVLKENIEEKLNLPLEIIIKENYFFYE
jgi:LacI family transcriptional regulator